MRAMRHRYIGGALLAAAAMLAGPSVGQAQFNAGTGPFTTGEGGGFQTPILTDQPSRTPFGRPGDAGFYTAFEFVMLTQTRAIGHQTIATRGFIDSDGSITGTPGTFIGPNTVAINTRDFSPRTFQPGFFGEVGYIFDDRTRIFFNYMQLIEAHYSLGASQVPFGFGGPANLSGTFLTSPVFNFNNAFGGPAQKVNGVGNFAVFGIW